MGGVLARVLFLKHPRRRVSAFSRADAIPATHTVPVAMAAALEDPAGSDPAVKRRCDQSTSPFKLLSYRDLHVWENR